MKKKIIGIFVFIIMITPIVSSAMGFSKFKKTNTDEKNLLLKEAELTLHNDNIAHVGYLNCTSWYTPFGDIPYVIVEPNDVHVIWLEGSGCIQATWNIKIPPGGLFFENIIVYKVGFYLRVFTKNNYYYQDKFEDTIHANDERSGTFSKCIVLNENDFNKIGDEYKVECVLKAEVCGYLFGIFPIPKLYSQDWGYPEVYVKVNI